MRKINDAVHNPKQFFITFRKIEAKVYLCGIEKYSLMSHESHHGHSTENKTIISFKNSFWLVVIVVGLFIAALNFIQAESGGEEGHHGEGKETTEKEAVGDHKEPKAEEMTPADRKPEDENTKAPATDSAAKHAE